MSNTTLNMNDQIELLSVPLPEDVLKHKWHGDFAAMERIIDRRLHSEIEDVMRRRLLLEKCIMKKLPRNYPYTMEQAVELFQDAVYDFQPEEMQELMDSDYADWIYIQGVPHFRNNVVANVLKTRPDYAARRKVQPQEAVEESRALHEILEEMEVKGGVSRTIRQRSRLWLEEDAGVEPGEIVKVWLPVPGVDAQIKAVRILDDGKGFVGGMECIRMELGEPDASGRRRPIEKAGSEFVLDVDCVIMAIGTSPNPLIKSTTDGLETQRWGGIVADEVTGQTSREGVFAGGDAVTGAATVILAMGAGKAAAKAMDEYIQNK